MSSQALTPANRKHHENVSRKISFPYNEEIHMKTTNNIFNIKFLFLSWNNKCITNIKNIYFNIKLEDVQ